jgi:hypothetical protein
MLLGLSVGVGSRGATKTDAQDGYRKAKATKRRETGVRESEQLIVPSKRGNDYRANPAEGRSCRIAEPLEGNMTGASEPDSVSTKRQRIADVATVI